MTKPGSSPPKKAPRHGDIFIDHHLGGNIAAAHQLEHAAAQDGAQDGIHPLQLPFLRQRAGNGAVDLDLVLRHAVEDGGEEILVRRDRQFGEAVLDEFLRHFLGAARPIISIW